MQRKWWFAEILIGVFLTVAVLAIGVGLAHSLFGIEQNKVAKFEQGGLEKANHAVAPLEVSADERIADYTLWLTTFTLVLGVATILLWWETRRGIRLTRDLHDATQRPWLSLKLKSVTQVLKRDNYALIRYVPVVANVGRSPAFDVHAFHQLVRDFDANPKPDFDLFIQQSEQSYTEPSRDRSSVLFPDGQPDERAEQTVSEYRDTPQSIVGKYYLLFLCVLYRASSGGEVHRTASLYRLELVAGDLTSPSIVFGSTAEERPFKPMGLYSAT